MNNITNKINFKTFYFADPLSKLSTEPSQLFDITEREVRRFRLTERGPGKFVLVFYIIGNVDLKVTHLFCFTHTGKIYTVLAEKKVRGDCTIYVANKGTNQLLD